MKKILLASGAMALVLAVTNAQAVTMGSGMNTGGQGYSGTGQTRGFVSKTGFVKERTNEEDHMDGKEKPVDDKKETTDEEDVRPADTDADASEGKSETKSK